MPIVAAVAPAATLEGERRRRRRVPMMRDGPRQRADSTPPRKPPRLMLHGSSVDGETEWRPRSAGDANGPATSSFAGETIGAYFQRSTERGMGAASEPTRWRAYEEGGQLNAEHD